ncbi:NAD kinase [Limibacter armeniacum]|uniref:NAD kinase n=1 Tax=Limibacter armeniacum TaxID=466084 RepID=UPI002FE611C9
MTRIAIHSRKLDPEKVPFLFKIIDNLSKRSNVDLLLSAELSDFISTLNNTKLPVFNVFKDHKDLEKVHYMISFGGDGTLLQALTYIKDLPIPVLGVNAGRLGFLATTPKENVEAAIDAMLNGNYTIDERIMLKLESNQDIFNGLNFGLNEFTITKRDTSSMIQVHTYLDGEYLNTYWADGLIVSTPTGSTGYSLSVGGPVVIPDSNNFIISPVCPHNLNVRPLVVSDNSVISFEIEGRSKNFLVSLDTRSRAVDASIKLAVRKNDYPARLIKFSGDNFLNTLRIKLNWGIDARN